MVNLFPHYSLEISKRKENPHISFFVLLQEERKGGREAGKGNSKLSKKPGQQIQTPKGHHQLFLSILADKSIAQDGYCPEQGVVTDRGSLRTFQTSEHSVLDIVKLHVMFGEI